MKNKKAISNVVGMILIVLLSLIAVSILGIIIKNITNDLLESPEINCLEFKTNPPMSIKDSCYNLTTKNLAVKVERPLTQDAEINLIDFVVQIPGENSKSFSCSNSCETCSIVSGGMKEYFFNIQSLPEKIILKANGCILETKETKAC